MAQELKPDIGSRRKGTSNANGLDQFFTKLANQAEHQRLVGHAATIAEFALPRRNCD